MIRQFFTRFSAKSIYITISLIAGITLTALVILSYLLTKESIRNNEEFTRKSFLSKYEIVQFEVNRIIQEQILVKKLIEEEQDSAQIGEKLALLNEVQQQHNLKIHHWWHKSNQYGRDDVLTREKESLVWTIYDSIPLSEGAYIYYGLDLDLLNLHQYFAGINQNSQNYVFIFDKNGKCITHPDEKNIGKNVFDFTSITPADTLITNQTFKFSEHQAVSEFLPNSGITRFIKPLNVNGFEGYVAVGHLDFIVEENVRPTQMYVLVIFVVTIFLVSIIFLFLHALTRQADKEKQSILNDNNALLIKHEKMVKENALNQLEQLKNQIQPHFLFNSLNTLYMIISMDQKKAQRFTMNLSRIYRYLIVPPKDHLVIVEKEIEFIRYYLSLQNDRFQEELDYNVVISSEDKLNKKIPYLALQLVVENALKHNIATIAQPLFIAIELTDKFLLVTNTYQPRNDTTDNVHFGSEYLYEIYLFYGIKTFQTNVDNGQFICKLPLLD